MPIRRLAIMVAAALLVPPSTARATGKTATSTPRLGVAPPPALTAALLDQATLPNTQRWSRYAIPKRARRGLCGQPLRRGPNRQEASIAWAQDPRTGPILGERLEVFSAVADGRLVMRSAREMVAHCHREVRGGSTFVFRGQAFPRLGDEALAFRIDGRTREGLRAVTYEVLVARARVLAAFSLATLRPDPPLLQDLVARGTSRAWAFLASAASTHST